MSTLSDRRAESAVGSRVTTVSRWRQLAALGQSVWYDNVARPALASGLLKRILEEDHVTGGTSNPSIFAAAVSGSDVYDHDIRASGPTESVGALFERLAGIH